MKESREQIAARLKKYYAQDLKDLHTFVAASVRCNVDFVFAADREREEIGEMVGQMVGKKLTFDPDELLTEEEMDLYKELLYSDEEKMKKAQRVDLLSRVLDNDTLFEGMCLTFFDQDEGLEMMCGTLGCRGKYEELQKDPVYCKRRAWFRLVSDYAHAAVRLYGAIRGAELELLIRALEPQPFDVTGYEREEGSYRHTLAFSPEWLCLYTLHHLVGDSMRDISTTLDVVFAHRCFGRQVNHEHEQFMTFAESLGRTLDEKDLDKFYSEVVDESYFRELLDCANDYDRYVPEREEFLKYAEEYYLEDTKEAAAFEAFLWENFREDLTEEAKEREAQNPGYTAEDCVHDFMYELQLTASDMCRDEAVHAFQIIEEMMNQAMVYSLSVEEQESANDYLFHALQLTEAVRKWELCGHTQREIRDAEEPMPADELVVVPETARAAKWLRRYPAVARIRTGLRFNLDYTAADVRAFAASGGKGRAKKTAAKRIYPMDPCICGSGKPFVECCGKRG